MNKHIFSISIILFVFSSLKGQNNQININNIHNVLEQWKKDVIKDSTFLYVCPRMEDFEKMNEKRAEKLANSIIFPKTFHVSYGNYNNDEKIDALVSFNNFSCYSNYSGRVAPNSYNTSDQSLLISSNFDGYEISKEIEIEVLKSAVKNYLNASRVEISLSKIIEKGIVGGTSLIWVDYEDENFLGLCCPNFLTRININIEKRKIFIFIDELNDIQEFGY